MRLYIQEKNNLVKFNLPIKIDGSMLFSYKSKETGLEKSINVDAIDGEWVLKSNGNVNIVLNNSFVDKIVLKDYMCVPLSIIGTNSYVCLFCLPSIEDTEYAYSIGEINNITIGKDNSNIICYDQNMMFPRHAILKKENNIWYIAPALKDINYYIYVNNKRVIDPIPVYAGDVIFMNGLRIIWMQKFIKIPMANNLYRVNGLAVFESQTVVSNKDYSPVSEVDSNILLYNDNEYFSHTPRIRTVVEKEIVKVDAPPDKQDKDNDMPFLLSIGSSFTMLGMTSMNAYNIINNIASGEKDISTQIPGIVMCVTMIAGSLIIPTLTKTWQKKLAKQREKKRQDKYSEYLLKKEEQFNSLKRKQEQIFIESYPDLMSCLKIVETKNRLFWNREIKNDDFIEIRLGLGNRPSLIELSAPEESFTLDDDNLYQAVCALGQKYDLLENVPITVSFKDQIVTALILSSNFSNSFIDSMMLQLMTYHSPLELKLVIITDDENSYHWDYTRYVPHCWSDDKNTRFFGTKQEDFKALSLYLDNEFNSRVEKKAERAKASKEVNKDNLDEYELYESYYLIITDNFKAIKNLKIINSILDNQFNYGFSLVVIEKDMKNLPKECQKFIVIDDVESGMFSGTIKESDTIRFKAEYINGLNMRGISSKLGNVPIQGKDLDSQLPQVLSFLEMFNVGKIEQLNVRNRWINSDPMQSLQVPVGVHVNGDLFKLDLHEKFDGPHGLIAGSTGSGKSEFIITYILSMALNYDPREVQFVLIDYKGGGLAGAFENREKGISIPHLAGTITNLDTAEMNRTLVSIESELKRRQRKFNEVREATGESTMDIYKYQKLYREGVIDSPISHLFIISDEFAELKAQQPDFMAQLISTARIGRSLGVHLVLATQKPSGVVNDQIWSNSKFKVCLKVQSRADSMEMLKRPEAASIKEAGRFYLQVGYDEYFDIGQSAWAGSKYNPVERIVKKLDDSIQFVDNCGNTIKRINDIIKQENVAKKDFGDELTNIVNYLNNISLKDGIISQKLWLPSLQKNILLNDLLKKYQYSTKELNFNPVLGEYDAPRDQKQGLLTVDLIKDGNMLIFGNGGSGKENILSTLIFNLSIYHSPLEINIYIGDFGAETLKNFKKFPQVGDVFTIEEKDKLENLIKMLDKELERRKKEYSDFGGNYLEYCKLSGKKDAFILIILNNYENFCETYTRMSDVFVPFFRDGSKYGINFILSTTVQSSVRGRILQNFLTRICLKMPNDYDYRDLLGAPKGMIPADNFGRGIISIDGNNIYEFQTADIVKRDQRTAYLKEVAKKLNEKYPEDKALKIPVLPNVLYVEDVVHELKSLEWFPIGIEKNSLDIYVINFLEMKINLIAAKSLKNHIYFVYALIKQMLMLKNVKVHIIDALNMYRGNYEGINLYQDNFDNAFVMAYKNVENDEKLKDINVYLCLGISEFMSKVSNKYSKNFNTLFKNVNYCKNNVFLFFDDTIGYKKMAVEGWYRENINNTYGIWLGEDIGSQIALGVMSLSLEDKQNVFPCIGYPIYKGNHMTLKYVVDGVEREDEE